MKKKLIRVMQRWGQTVLSPSLDEIHWNLRSVEKRVNALRTSLDFQRQYLQDLTLAVFYERWQAEPLRILSRAELGYWLNFRGLFGEGVEVGVHRGQYSELLLDTWQGRRLHSVDPWQAFSSDDYADVCNVSTTKQETNYEVTVQRLARFGERSSILRQTSREAAESFADASLDFVYIDAQHHYEAVREDLALWESKVRPNGIIGGHDYLDGEISSGRYGVKRAVEEWSKERGFFVTVTKEGPYPSWFVVQPDESPS